MKTIILAFIAAACGHAPRPAASCPPGAASVADAADPPQSGRSASSAAALLESVMGPTEVERPPVVAEQAFCCETASDNGTGSGCAAISSELINSCNDNGKTVLFCGGSYRFGDGKVSCID